MVFGLNNILIIEDWKKHTKTDCLMALLVCFTLMDKKSGGIHTIMAYSMGTIQNGMIMGKCQWMVFLKMESLLAFGYGRINTEKL